MLYQKLDESDISDALKLVSNVTDESLGQLQEDLEYYLEEEKKEEKKESEDTNPFSALFGMAGKKEKPKEKKEEKITSVKPDSYVEALVRKSAVENTERTCFDLFDIYKKAHDMASHPEPVYEDKSLGY